MLSSLFHVRRAPLASLLLAFSVPAALAQNPGSPQPAPTPAQVQQDADKEAGRRNQKIEHIHVEDTGATVDELRYGGQTQSITVKPKSNAPAYQVMPNEEDRQRQGKSESGPGDNGPRVWWNVFKF
jgi:hypothetical protein